MKKRIGSRIYDSEKSEKICDIEGGSLYRKRSHGKEWFIIFENGAIRPLYDSNSKDKELIDVGLQYVDKSKTSRTTIWVDRETYDLLASYADRNNMSITQAVKNIVESVIQK